MPAVLFFFSRLCGFGSAFVFEVNEFSASLITKLENTMAVISEYEEEEPVQTSKPQTSTQVHEIRLTPGIVTPPGEAASDDYKVDNQHDAVLNTLLEVHNQQPLELLTTVIDYLFRETDLSQQEGVESRVSEIVGAAKKRKSEADAEGAAAEKIAKKEVSESPKELLVDLNEAPVEEDVEEVNITSSSVIEPEDDEPAASDAKENIVPGVDDYDEKIDGKGLSKPLLLSVSFSSSCDDYARCLVFRFRFLAT